MFALIVLGIFGLGMAYFATQNTGVVHITLANYLLSGIPLYAIVIGSMLLGIFVSWLISMMDSISSSMTIHGKNSAIKDAKKTINDLKEEKYNLELENARLRGEQHDHESIEPQASLSHPLKHSFT